MAIIHGHTPYAVAPPMTGPARRVVVKMRQHATTAPAAAAASLSGIQVFVTQRVPSAAVRPYFGASPAPSAVAAAAATPLLDTRRYVAVDLPVDVDAGAIADELRAQPDVETAYVEGGPTPPPLHPEGNPRSVSQGYLHAAPEGIDAASAWQWGPTDGAGVTVVDVEQGWVLDHEDLAAANVLVMSGSNQAYRGHGTAVLGEIIAVDNGLGGIGIAPGASAHVVSQWRSATEFSTAAAIVAAAGIMASGSVLLIEAQTTYTTSGSDYVPVEVEALVFDAIRAAVDRGIVVIEAGGNGAVDLDAFVDVHGRHVLRRGDPEFRDSGAILVGAASSAVPHARLAFSNHGSRIDCFAWGENIDTCGDGWTGEGTSTYTTGFGGTSGASPIVTGCAVLLQAVCAARALPPFAPDDVRAWLSHPEVNTASASPDSDRIGVMPDLRAILTRAFTNPPSPMSPPLHASV